jgi:tetratricopeptide (TPR) repeat protein
VTYLEQALEALRHLPVRRDTTELAIDLRFDLRSALLPLGDWERMQDHLRTAETLALTLGDQRRLGRVSGYMVVQCALAQEYAEAVRFGRQALSIASALGDMMIEVPTNAYLGLAHESRGDHLAALEHLQRNISLITADLRHERFGQATIMASFSRSILSLALSGLGRFEEAIERAEEATRIAEEAGQRYSLAFAWRSLGEAHARRGDFARASTVLERCLDLCRTSEFHALMPATASSLAFALARDGRAAEALALAEELAGMRASRRLHAEETLVSLGAAYLLADRADAARAWAHEALEESRRRGARACEARAVHLIGEIASLGDQAGAGEAEGRYREALALASELGMRPLVAHCHLGLGKLSRQAGHPEQAKADVTAAATMYREMDMRFWLEKAEAVLGSLS